jgi:glycosyltransferase involved in cell wall biosynthesis
MKLHKLKGSEVISVVIPARNEEKNIGKVIQAIRKVSGKFQIIVIDDGSTDRTGEVARSKGCDVYRLKENRGKGYACRLGASRAKGDRIVFIDADGQFYPEEIPRLAERLDSCDIAIGARKMKSVPVQRRISNSFARRLVNSIAGRKYKDALCGFRAAKKDAFEKLGLEKDRYEFESEMLIKAAKRGLRVCEVPVKVRYLDYPGMPLTQSLKVTLYLLKNWIW